MRGGGFCLRRSDLTCQTQSIPEALRRPGPTLVCDGKWSFIDRGSDAIHPGYYLAIYRARNDVGEDLAGISRSLRHIVKWWELALSFIDFQRAVKRANPAIELHFGEGKVDTYTTHSGERIEFSLIPQSTVLAPLPTFDSSKFAHGSIINSDNIGPTIFFSFRPGTGVIKITNPALGTQIILDMQTEIPFHPRRTSETGEIEAPFRNEVVWVDFNYMGGPGFAGDFGDPFPTLAAARDHVAVNGTINIVPGATSERIIIGKKMTLRSFPGSATIGQP